MRPGEVDGINYHFISKSKFDEMLEAGEFIENAEVFGYSYGTSKQALKFLLKQGKDVILEIDWQGASQIRALFNNTVSIFIVPPSLQDLRKRLLNRNQDDLRTIDTRLNAAKNEIKHFFQYDYVIVNDNFDCALKDLMAIIRANRCRLETQSVVLEKLIQQLMN
jgi:guanylate kinase